jgi:low temperature requirement protein LtrA
MAQHQGWYDRRRIVQETVMLGLLVVMALLAVARWRSMRGTLARSGAALVLAVGFVAIHAIGFYHVDALYRYADKTGRDAPAAELAVRTGQACAYQSCRAAAAAAKVRQNP